MEQVNSTVTDTVHRDTTIPQSEPLHQYAPVPQYVSPVLPDQTSVVSSEVVAAGVMGVIVAGTGTLGANLHKVQAGDITMGEAVNDSLVRGAAGGVAAATAAAAANALTNGGLAGLAVTLAAATGVSYVLGKQ